MDNKGRLEALRRRLQYWLIEQTEYLLKVDSPFPLAVMTCVGCEATGLLFFGERNRDAEGTQRDCFVAMCGGIDQRFSRRLPKNFQERMHERWPGLKGDYSTSADIIYRFFRNSLIHGYRGEGVYITADETDDVHLDDGFLKLNPHWFWNRFRDCHARLWDEVQQAQENNPRRMSALAYLEDLLR